MSFSFGQCITVAGLLCFATALSAQQQSSARRDASVHDAASHYSFSRNAQGCRVDRLTNSRFILVPPAGPNTVLLETDWQRRTHYRADKIVAGAATGAEIGL
jgi:hypothetical protein